MSEMLEKVARAICGASVAYRGPHESPTIEERIDEGWKDYLQEARLALEAMMEPTPQMLAVFDDYHTMLYNPASTYRGIHTWQAMIRATLSEDKP